LAKKKNITIKQGLDGWVMTYGDMMSLLLTFFVLIVSFSSMQETKFEQAAASLADAFGVLANPESVIEFNNPIVPNHTPVDEEAEALYEVRSVERFILEHNLGDQVEVEVTQQGVLFRLDAPFLFKSGSTELEQAPAGLFEEISGFFRKFPYQVKIGGHTDNVPIGSARYPSNWELSAGRAVTVARYFQELGVPPERVAATGYGEYRPLVGNDTPEGRTRNRRVEVFLQFAKEDMPEKNKLDFVDPEPGASPTAAPPAEFGPQRQIINPVTGRLGSLTGQIQP